MFLEYIISPNHFSLEHLQKIYGLLTNLAFPFPICDLWEFVQFLLVCLLSVGGLDAC